MRKTFFNRSLQLFIFVALALVACDDDSGNNVNNVNNVNNTIPAGDFKGPCLAGDLCNGELLCVSGICEADADGDGYTTANDCDDTDEHVYPGKLIPCESICETGTQQCLQTGEFTDCTASTECDCVTPGEIREWPCGNCGVEAQLCNDDLQWEHGGECESQEPCIPEETGSSPCGLGGTQQFLCSDECQWEEASECEGSMECIPGTVDLITDDCSPLGFLREETCSDEGFYEESMACSDGCLLTPRAGGTWPGGDPDFKDEVCIPGGPFIMGYDLDAQTINPEHTVSMTPYFMDVYKVTNDRYRECVTAGVCAIPVAQDSTFSDSAKGDHPVTGITVIQAQEFCQWDGGRSLPTEAQWEKGAKGPYPRNSKYPWDGTEINCDLANGLDCWTSTAEKISVGQNSLGISYYGLYQMLGNVEDWVDDDWDENAYANHSPLDPHTPMNAGTAVRGAAVHATFDREYFNISFRHAFNTTFHHGDIGFRCAQRGY